MADAKVAEYNKLVDDDNPNSNALGKLIKQFSTSVVSTVTNLFHSFIPSSGAFPTSDFPVSLARRSSVSNEWQDIFKHDYLAVSQEIQVGSYLRRSENLSNSLLRKQVRVKRVREEQRHEWDRQMGELEKKFADDNPVPRYQKETMNRLQKEEGIQAHSLPFFDVAGADLDVVRK
jgi:hypothetical protein